jgi:hypothetical protein
MTSWNPEIPLPPIKIMDQHFNGLHHGTTTVRRTWHQMGYYRPTHKNTIFRPLPNNYLDSWPSRYVLAAYWATLWAPWYHYLGAWATICKWLLATTLYQTQNPVVTPSCIPSWNWWPNETCQYSVGTIALDLRIPPIGWLVPLAPLGWVHHQ